MGQNSSYPVGKTGGSSTHNHSFTGTVGATTLTIDQMPNHTHSTRYKATHRDCGWDTNPKWAGFLCLQDYTSANNEAALEAKLFASDKITINLTNVTGPNGKITTPEDMSLAFGSQDPEKQLGYVIYGPELTTLPYTGNESMYPTFNIK